MLFFCNLEVPLCRTQIKKEAFQAHTCHLHLERRHFEILIIELIHIERVASTVTAICRL